ncbi:MAG: 2-succinyl-5-enolpyruvyl-6-hydroxy-3-cyclohexene-1-carboxylic-acid synthase [bacterium]|nr:2-succinyl-5-enolpyruvyl-6-hydroxy-3-cyclohexene-1-carboxylic-acid synthase [bacterium]
MEFATLNALHAAVLIGELALAGVKRAVISPGSRSTALARAAVEHPTLQTYTILDERSAAFFALGLSKADGAPAILICTSGTAGANYFPAVIEAAKSGVPLLILTADRPTRLRHTCALQTMDQTQLYGNFTAFFADVPAAALNFDACFWVRCLARQAFDAATEFSAGPAHLNVPLEELSEFSADESRRAREVWSALQQTASTARHAAATPLAQEALAETRKRVDTSLCGLIVAGPGAAAARGEAATVFHLARKLGWPLLADVTSGLRFFDEPSLPFYDVFLRAENFASLAPDAVLHFGGFPTSKALANYLDHHRDAKTVRFGREIDRGDPLARDGIFVEANPADFCSALAETIGPSRDSLLLEPFQRAARGVREELSRPVGDDSPESEALFVREAVRSLPDAANVVFANSLPIRYGDALLSSEDGMRDVFALRGVSGIDGTISHAAGIAAASRKPTLLVCGDLAFLHDLTGLIAAANYAPTLTTLLLDNNGGGIFHFLPALENEDQTLFEAIHGTPHDLDLSATGALFGVDWSSLAHPAQFDTTMAASSGRPRVFHVRSSRGQNYAAHMTLIERLKKASGA